MARAAKAFHEATELPFREQDSFLKAACGLDDSLLQDVRGLLAEDAKSGSLLEQDLAHIAHRVLDDSFENLRCLTFGPYRLVRLLGEGGMGVVYLAERKDLGSFAAIKILRDAWLSPSRRERFQLEQQTLARLNHPSIARLYDASALSDGTPYFVMEYVEGQPINEYCQDHKASIETRLRLFRSVCQAVQFSHGHTIIHRDLKPSNILVTTDGSIKLLDFGIAKQMENLDEWGERTRTGFGFMTPAYAAPEQLCNESTGIYTDVYSLGVVLYQLLVETLPFDLRNRTPGQAELLLAEQAPERPSSVARRLAEKAHTKADQSSTGKALWADLDVLCLTAMHKEVARRYQSVEALIRDIDHFLKGEPLEASADTASYRLGKFIRRNKSKLAVTAAVLSAAVALIVFFTLRLANARNAALAQAVRAERVQKFMLRLFDGGNEEMGPSQDLRVTTLLDRGLRDAQTLGSEPEVQGQLFDMLGTMYQQLGDFDKADGLLAKALTRREALYGKRNADVADTLVELGMLRMDEGKLDQAEQFVQEGLAIDKQVLMPDNPKIAKYTSALGSVLLSRNNYPEAVRVLNEAKRLQSGRKDQVSDLDTTLTLLANAEFYLGHYFSSYKLNQSLLPIDEQMRGKGDPGVGIDLVNLGNIEQNWEHYGPAESYFRRALDIYQSWYGKQHREVADIKAILAQTLVSEQRYEEAQQLIESAIETQQHIYGKTHTRLALAFGVRGRLNLELGKLDAAEIDFDRMLGIYRTIFGDDGSSIPIALANLGDVYMKKNDYRRAEMVYRDALRRFDAALPANHPRIAQAQIRLGGTLVAERHYSEAQEHLLAGYNILTMQKLSATSWFKRACTNLVAAYDALKEPEKAKRFQTAMTLANR